MSEHSQGDERKKKEYPLTEMKGPARPVKSRRKLVIPVLLTVALVTGTTMVASNCGGDKPSNEEVVADGSELPDYPVV